MGVADAVEVDESLVVELMLVLEVLVEELLVVGLRDVLDDVVLLVEVVEVGVIVTLVVLVVVLQVAATLCEEHAAELE